MISRDTGKKTQGEGNYPIKIDAEERKLGQEIGFGTLVLLTVNDEWKIFIINKCRSEHFNHSALQVYSQG